MTDEMTVQDAGKQIVTDLVKQATAVGADGKPGWKTTEFWLTTGCMVLSGGAMAYAMYRGQDWLVAAAMSTGVVKASVYTLARSAVKKAQ